MWVLVNILVLLAYPLISLAYHDFQLQGIYANLKTLKTKIASLPFSFSTEADSITSNTKPLLTLTLSNKDFYNSQFNCFVSGQNTAKIAWLSKDTVTVQAKEPLGLGRARYNCTAPSKKYPGSILLVITTLGHHRVRINYFLAQLESSWAILSKLTTLLAASASTAALGIPHTTQEASS